MPGRSDFRCRVPTEWREDISQAAAHLGTSSTTLVLGVAWAIARVLNRHPELFEGLEQIYEGGGSQSDMVADMVAKGLLQQAKSSRRRLRRKKKTEPDA